MNYFHFFILSTLFILNIHYTFCSDKESSFFTKQFSSFAKDKRLTINTSSFPYQVLTSKDIPANATLFKISPSQMFSSCSSFPYKEEISSLIISYLKQQRIVRGETYHEALILIFQLFYFQFNNIEQTKQLFKENITNFRYEINQTLQDYIHSISEVSKQLAYFDMQTNPSKQKYLNKLGITHRNYEIVSTVYDYVVEGLKNNTNENNNNEIILSFVDNKKDLFIRMFYYIYERAIPISGNVFEKVFNISESITPNTHGYCIMLSPVTDLLVTKVNKDKHYYNFDTYAYTDIKKNNRTYVLFYTKLNINEGPIVRYSLLTNEDAFLDLNITSKDLDFNSRQIKVEINRDVFTENKKENKHLQICQMTRNCGDIRFVDGTVFAEFSLIEDKLNPRMVNIGRFVNLKDDEIKDVNLISSTFVNEGVVNYENEMKAIVWVINAMGKDFGLFDKLFNSNNEERFDDVWDLAYINYNINLKNYEMGLEQMILEMKREIKKYI